MTTPVSIRRAFTALATFAATVSGMIASYDLDDLPRQINRGSLPCALLNADISQTKFSTATFQGNAVQIEFTIKQLVLVAPTQDRNAATVAPAMITMLDSYLQAVKAKPFLSEKSDPVIHHPTVFSPKAGAWIVGDVEYWGIEFTHTLRLHL